MMDKRKLFLMILVALFCTNSYAQNIHIKTIDEYINTIEKNNLDVGSICIFKQGKEAYYRNFGTVAHQNFSRNSTYQVGSITKLFTSILIFKLIENNTLTLDTKLFEFFPEIENSNNITIKNLLEHSSGLGNYVKKDGKTPWLGEARTKNEIMTEIKSQKSLFKPNDSVSYSNSGYYLLGQIIEQKYQKNYADAVQDIITKPLHLTHTQSVLHHPKNVSTSLQYSENGWIKKSDFYFENIVGVGDISSNTWDLNELINLLFENKILKKESLETMKPVIGKEIYGRGLMNFNFHNITFYGNTGGTYGTNTIVLYEPKTKISIALIINGERYKRDELITDIVNIVFNDKLNQPHL